MTTINLEGPDYGVIGQTVYFQLKGIDDQSKYTITWYKGGRAIPFSPKETDHTRLYLYGIEGPAAGSYYAVVNDGVDDYTTESIDFEVGSDFRDPSVFITLAHAHNSGDSVSVNAAWTVKPECCASVASCTWYDPNGDVVSNNEVLTVNNINSSNSGVYTALVELSQIGGYAATSETETIQIGSSIKYKPLYIHDLRPARDAGFIWMGWWVIDEIKQAIKDDFDWLSDPTNSRFTYPKDLYTLSIGFKKWADLDIQESRNGYILNKKDIT